MRQLFSSAYFSQAVAFSALPVLFPIRPFVHVGVLWRECVSKLATCFGNVVAKISPTFSDHISRIVHFCAKEKMRWIHARRVVALMAGAQSCRDFSVYQGPAEPMRFARSPANSKFAVSEVIARPDPFPAAAGSALVDLRPKPLNIFRSFYHKLILYVEVRARLASDMATALAYFNAQNAERNY